MFLSQTEACLKTPVVLYMLFAAQLSPLVQKNTATVQISSQTCQTTESHPEHGASPSRSADPALRTTAVLFDHEAAAILEKAETRARTQS